MTWNSLKLWGWGGTPQKAKKTQKLVVDHS